MKQMHRDRFTYTNCYRDITGVSIAVSQLDLQGSLILIKRYLCNPKLTTYGFHHDWQLQITKDLC